MASNPSGMRWPPAEAWDLHSPGFMSPNAKRSMWVTALIGIGTMAALDEILFHQILQWHHFYDQASPTIGIMSDGFLHAAEWIAIVAGFFLFSEMRRSGALVSRAAWAGFFLGLGGFQLFDGIVDHKVLRLHQIRYEVDLLPYDLAWNFGAVVLIAIGLVLARQVRSESRREVHASQSRPTRRSA